MQSLERETEKREWRLLSCDDGGGIWREEYINERVQICSKVNQNEIYGARAIELFIQI